MRTEMHTGICGAWRCVPLESSRRDGHLQYRQVYSRVVIGIRFRPTRQRPRQAAARADGRRSRRLAFVPDPNFGKKNTGVSLVAGIEQN